MFNNSKYTRWYYNIINNAITNTREGYTEKHHIIPKSLGGSNDKTNIVKLTAREHFICHMLLTKMVITGKDKMAYAAWQLGRSLYLKDIKISSKTYQVLKEQLSKAKTGVKRKPFSEQARKNMSEARIGEKNHMTGRKRTTEEKALMSKNRKGLTAKEKNPFYGKSHSQETIEKVREVNSRIHTCPHCGKTGVSNVMQRWHFDNCKAYSNDQC